MNDQEFVNNMWKNTVPKDILFALKLRNAVRHLRHECEKLLKKPNKLLNYFNNQRDQYGSDS